MPEYQCYFRGHNCMSDSNFYSSYRCYMKEAFIDIDANFHSEDEYLCFTGYDMLDPWGSFDAEIEFWIGKDLNKLEKHIITKPTLVRIPAFYWHCPLQYKRVGKPVYLQVLVERGKMGKYLYQPTEDGGYTIEFPGLNGPSNKKKCVMDPTKDCTVCGKCWTARQKQADPKSATESAMRYMDIEW